MPIETVEMDVREGGTLEGDDVRRARAEGDPLGGRVPSRSAEPERLVLTMTDSPGEPERAVITVELTDLGDGRTEMTMEQRSPLPPDQVEGARSGWGSFFDRMGERLA